MIFKSSISRSNQDPSPEKISERFSVNSNSRSSLKIFDERQQTNSQSFAESSNSSNIRAQLAEKGLIDMQNKYELMKKQLDEEEE